MTASLDVVYSTILQNGIRKFKYKNSRLKPVSFSEQTGKGAIFAYRSKEHMVEGIGLVITSEEGIIENNNALVTGPQTSSAMARILMKAECLQKAF
ncbi:hypothetical protein [Enterococcus faecium]|uniref:hypothetical protein n=1 Tax=Enterococcus faecium TaxID=1352 RepID=UPI001F507DEC|nr:hypothetical protein [Enterococcus faecium]